MNLAGLILRAAGWHVNITVPPYPRSVICVAPHTSNWDFVLGKLAYASVGRKAGFLMKETWFFIPYERVLVLLSFRIFFQGHGRHTSATERQKRITRKSNG